MSKRVVAGKHDEALGIVRDMASARLLGAALAIGVASDLLFYGKAMGLSWAIFVALLVVALLAAVELSSAAVRRSNWWLAAVLLVLAPMVALRANGFVTALNIIACLGLLSLVAAFQVEGRVQDLPLVGYVVVAARTVLETLVRPVSAISRAIDCRALRTLGGSGALPIARGLILALPVLAVFLLLLAGADLVFAQYLARLVGLDLIADVAELGVRGVLALAVAWLVLGWLRFALRVGGEQPLAGDSAPEGDRSDRAGDAAGPDRAGDAAGSDRAGGVAWQEAPGAATWPDQRGDREAMGPLASDVLAAADRLPRLGAVEANTILGAVAVLFAAFVWIQFAYLFGGQVNIQEHGFTYSEYARRGFFELVTVALLAVGLIVGLRAVTSRRGRPVGTAFSVLGGSISLLVLVMLVSAHTRLELYEVAYGYTQLRLYSHVFIAWLGPAVLWLGIAVWMPRDRFAFGAFLCALGFLATLNAVNPDASIAYRNLERFAKSGELDARYLTRLSNDAVPALVDALGAVDDDARDILERDLIARRQRLGASDYLTRWQSFHLGHRRAYEALGALPHPLRAHDAPGGR